MTRPFLEVCAAPIDTEAFCTTARISPGAVSPCSGIRYSGRSLQDILGVSVYLGSLGHRDFPLPTGADDESILRHFYQRLDAGDKLVICEL